MTSFSFIPETLRVPGAYAEISNERALRGLLPAFNQRILVMGQRLATGTVAANIPTTTLTDEQAAEYFGRGSMLHRMFQSIVKNNGITETIAIALDDNGAGAAAVGSIDFTGSVATSAGTLNIYIGGRRAQVGIAVGDAATAIVLAAVAAINVVIDMPVTAAVNGVDDKIVDLTADHKGENGNDIDVRINYYTGEITPAGLTVASINPVGGSGNPEISSIIAAVGGEHYDYFIMPWTDGANITALEAELASRFQPLVEMEGHAFLAKAGTQAELTTWGNARNSPHLSVMGMDSSPTPPEEIAAAFGAVSAFHLNIDPARPLQTLPLNGVLAPGVSDRFTLQESNILLFDGISVSKTDFGGLVRIQRAITTYQKNAQGADDPSYLDVTTLATMAYLRRSWRARMLQVFPRHKLADDGTRFGAGQAIVTPRIAKGETIALARQWEEAGLVEGIDQFKNDIIVDRSLSDVSRLNFLIPPNIVNGALVFAGRFEYIL
jgi:phage tail sheath gpL-like